MMVKVVAVIVAVVMAVIVAMSEIMMDMAASAAAKNLCGRYKKSGKRAYLCGRISYLGRPFSAPPFRRL